jgi:hypothetical protein
MPTTGTPLAGTGGRASVDGVNLRADKWQATPAVNDLVTTNFESVGDDGFTYEEGIMTGIRSCELSIELFWDADQEPHTDPPNLRPGVIISDVLLYVSRDLTPFTADEVRVTSVPIVTELNGVVRMTVVGRTNGQFTLPGQ